MNSSHVATVADGSFHAKATLRRSLREIDRRALNAIVHVKRHGKRLAGYGIVAQAFREQAAELRVMTDAMQELMRPLIYAQMEIVRDEQTWSTFRRVCGPEGTNTTASTASLSRDLLDKVEEKLRRKGRAHKLHMRTALLDLLRAVEMLQECVSAQEYVVVNGRIEAALLPSDGGDLLMQVSADMAEAVSATRQAVERYRRQLEEILHEIDADL